MLDLFVHELSLPLSRGPEDLTDLSSFSEAVDLVGQQMVIEDLD